MKKQVLKNCEVELLSQNGIEEGRFYQGFGQMKRSGKMFRFEEERPEYRKHNPLLFSGTVLRVRPTQNRQVRLTAVLKEDLVKDEIRRFLKQLKDDICVLEDKLYEMAA